MTILFWDHIKLYCSSLSMDGSVVVSLSMNNGKYNPLPRMKWHTVPLLSINTSIIFDEFTNTTEHECHPLAFSTEFIAIVISVWMSFEVWKEILRKGMKIPEGIFYSLESVCQLWLAYSYFQSFYFMLEENLDNLSSYCVIFFLL